MQQKNTGKIIVAFLLVTALAVVSVFSVLQFIKDPTPEQIADYKAENGIKDDKKTTDSKTELGFLTEEEKTTEKQTTEEITTEEKTTEEKTTEEKTTEEKTTEEKTTEKPSGSGDLALEDVAGTYTGKGTYTRLKFDFPDEMFEGMSENEIDAAMAMIKALEGADFDIAFSIDEDGSWDFAMEDGLMNFEFDSYDFSKEITELEDGGFSMKMDGKEEGIDAEAAFNGAFSGKGDNIKVKGSFILSGDMDGAIVDLIVDYEAELTDNADEDEEGV